MSGKDTTASNEAQRTTFAALADAWEEHVRAHREASSPHVFVDHPAFERICALGAAAVPLVIERYRRDGAPLFWGAALSRMTGNATFGDGLVGALQETRARWLAWADAPR